MEKTYEVTYMFVGTSIKQVTLIRANDTAQISPKLRYMFPAGNAMLQSYKELK